MSFNKFIKKIYKKGLKVFNQQKKCIYLSFGENCLTDRILERHHIKSFSSPYSSGRSNIEYILQIEKENFKSLLDKKYLYIDIVGDQRVVRNKKYICSNRYSESCMQDFEFTHHNVLEDDTIRKIISRRCKVLKSFEKKRVYIFYHHRFCKCTDEEKLIADLVELKELYEKKAKSVSVILFTQVIVDNYRDRKVVYENVNNIDKYMFYTLNVWEGSDDDIFWAKCDDDLIKIMIDDIKER